jgi:hypothetical protein
MSNGKQSAPRIADRAPTRHDGGPPTRLCGLPWPAGRGYERVSESVAAAPRKAATAARDVPLCEPQPHLAPASGLTRIFRVGTEGSQTRPWSKYPVRHDHRTGTSHRLGEFKEARKCRAPADTSSQLTRRWSKGDSNRWSHPTAAGGTSIQRLTPSQRGRAR